MPQLGLIFALGAFAFGLTRAEAIRIAFLLAGGGEFAFIVFKLAEDLGLIETKLSNLLTASVIISMSLTPLLGEVAEYVGDLVDRIDAGNAANAKADELFDVIDVDGNGSIEREELRSYLLGGGEHDEDDKDNDSFETLFEMLDINQVRKARGARTRTHAHARARPRERARILCRVIPAAHCCRPHNPLLPPSQPPTQPPPRGPRHVYCRTV